MPGRIAAAEATSPINFSAFSAPVSTDDVRDYRRAAATPRQRAADGRIVAESIMLIVVAIFVVPILLGVLVGVFVLALTPGQTFSDAILWTFLVAGVGLLLAWFVYALRRDVHFGSKWKPRVRLARFARDNGLAYTPAEAGIAFPGLIFSNPSTGARFDVFTVSQGRGIQFGNYVQQDHGQRRVAIGRWGYLMIELDRRMPHMFVQSKQGSRRSRLATVARLKRGQILSLEGDFDRYFALYAPKEYERDALYVFTPDLMALLIDRAAQFDVEIVDKWMFVYSRKPFDFSRPHTQQLLASVIQVIGRKTMNQTALYSDDKVGNRVVNFVAPGGRRLIRGVSVGGLLVMVYIVLRALGVVLEANGH